MVAAAGIVALLPFFGRAKSIPRTPHEAPAIMLIGPLALAAAGLVFGLAPPVVGQLLVQPAVTAVDRRGADRQARAVARDQPAAGP